VGQEPPRGDRSGGGRRRLQATHSYGFVLLLVVCSFVYAALAPSEAWGAGVLLLLQCATLATSLWTSGLGPDAAKGTVALLVVAVVASCAELFAGGAATDGGIGLLSALLAVAACVVIGRGVVDQQVVNARSVLGAICIYLLLGMLFTFVYNGVARIDDGPLFTNGGDADPATRLYFSFVTLATVGYGDYTLRTNLGHMLSVVEALIGQLYLVTVVAVLVANLRGVRRP
jgi:hypothetical protein